MFGKIMKRNPGNELSPKVTNNGDKPDLGISFKCSYPFGNNLFVCKRRTSKRTDMVFQ